MQVNIKSEELHLNIKKMVAKRVSSVEDQDDIVQDVFLRIIQYAKVDEPASFFSWLRLAVRSAIASHYRKSSKLQVEFKDRDLLLAQEEEGEERADLTKCLRPFLREMNGKDADLIQEIDLEGRSQKELSKELKINYSTLKSRLQKSRKILARKILSCCGEDRASDCC